MDEKKTTLEVIAPTVEEAIDKGLSELGLKAEDVEVEVLDEGKRNVFHFATRQARIRLTVKEADKKLFDQGQPAPETTPPQPAEQPSQPKIPEREDRSSRLHEDEPGAPARDHHTADAECGRFPHCNALDREARGEQTTADAVAIVYAEKRDVRHVSATNGCPNR